MNIFMKWGWIMYLHEDRVSFKKAVAAASATRNHRQRFYRSDYDNVTSYFVHQKVEYEAALEQLQLLADSGIF